MDRWKMAAIHAFKGARFDDGAIDVDALNWLGAYRELVLDVAKAVWRAENRRQRLPRGFEEGFQLRLSRLERGSALATIEQGSDQGSQLGLLPDVYATAMRLVEDSVQAASDGRPLPSGFPRSALGKFRRWGISFRDDESVEIRSLSGTCLATYTPAARASLLALVEASFENAADEVGFVLAASIRAGKFELYRERHSGEGVDVPLRPEDESRVMQALSSHKDIRLRVVGTGAYNTEGALVRFTKVDRVEPAERKVDNGSLWAAIKAIREAVPAEGWERVPEDGAQNHDRYL